MRQSRHDWQPGCSYDVDQLSYQPQLDGWARDRHYFISSGESRIEFYRPLSSVVLGIESHAPSALWVRFEGQALTAPVVGVIAPGVNQIAVPLSACPELGPWDIRIVSQTWNPLRLLGNGEDRELSFHLCSVQEVPVKPIERG